MREREREIKHLSVHQWLRSAIPDSQQPTSPIGFLFLKLPPPPCAVLLVGILNSLDDLGRHVGLWCQEGSYGWPIFRGSSTSFAGPAWAKPWKSVSEIGVLYTPQSCYLKKRKIMINQEIWGCPIKPRQTHVCLQICIHDQILDHLDWSRLIYTYLVDYLVDYLWII